MRPRRVAAREPGTRVFAFFLDELHVSPSSADLVRKTIAAFIDEKLEKCDLVAVMTPFDAARSVRFTRDRAFAYGVIDSFQGRKGDDRPRTMHETRARAAGGSDAQIVKTGLRDLAVRLGDLQAERPLLVVVSEGFPAQTDVRTPLQDLGGLLRAASRFHITTYSFNPAAVAPDHGAAAEQNTNRETLSWLAAATGGRAVAADQFLHGVAGLFHDAEAYYALTYQPAEPDGRFRSLDVRVKRSGVSVLTHAATGRCASATGEKSWRCRAAPCPATDRSLRRSPLVDAWVGVRREADGVARIAITWEPRRTDGAWPRLVAVKARAADGTPLSKVRWRRSVSGLPRGRSSPAFAAPPGRIDARLGDSGYAGNDPGHRRETRGRARVSTLRRRACRSCCRSGSSRQSRHARCSWLPPTSRPRQRLHGRFTGRTTSSSVSRSSIPAVRAHK